MKGVFIAIGSNIGDGVENCKEAIERLKGFTEVKSISPLYKTRAWGVESQADFINGVVEVETELSPTELLVELKATEKDMGRTESAHWGPRLIDMDIIFYGDDIIDTDELTVPHRYMHERAFVLAPLADIALEVIHPRCGKTVRELLNELNGMEGIEICQG